MTERRVAHRYDLSSPILVCKSLSPPEFYTGNLRDISTSGVYFLVDGSFAPGSHVELTLSLPLEITRGVQVLVRASGKVVRVDGQPTKTEPCGVAVIIQRYDIINPSASVAAA
jgi:PilZ domain